MGREAGADGPDDDDSEDEVADVAVEVGVVWLEEVASEAGTSGGETGVRYTDAASWPSGTRI
jgi:hypothetical protein